MEFELKADSWHFWMANFGKNRVSVHGSDICSYVRSFLLGLFWLVVTASFALSFTYATGVALYDGYAFFMDGTKVSLVAEIAIMLWTVIAGLFGILIFTFGLVEHAIPAAKRAIRAARKTDEPTFLGLAYRKFKDKTCFRIKFK